jgi:hypothetical protein
MRLASGQSLPSIKDQLTASAPVKEMGCASGAASNTSWTAVVSKTEIASFKLELEANRTA